VQEPARASSRKKPVRRFPRYATDFRISVELFRPEGSVSLWGLCSEFGEDGVSGTLTGGLKLGDVVSMEIAVYGGPLKLRAIVRYCEGLRHGFEFLALTREQRETLRRTCTILSHKR
jgi:hypothetical protein